MNTAQTEPIALANARARVENAKVNVTARLENLKLRGLWFADGEDGMLDALLREQAVAEKIVAIQDTAFAEAKSARVKDEERQFANSKPPWAFP